MFSSTDPLAELARHVEAEVFLDAFGNTADQLDQEYGQYEPSSVFFCVIDHLRSLPAGMIRILVPNPDPGLKSLNDLGRCWGIKDQGPIPGISYGLPQMATWDIASLAVARDYQAAIATGLVSLGLYQAVITVAQRREVSHMVAILDSVVHRMSRWKFHRPFQVLAGAAPLAYLGSEASIPVYCELSQWKARLAEKDPPLHEIIFAGRGLEAAIRPADLDRSEAIVSSLMAEACAGRQLPA